jgi:uncharacterized protein YdhG (YjbR/CyaY superfamily)
LAVKVFSLTSRPAAGVVVALAVAATFGWVTATAAVAYGKAEALVSSLCWKRWRRTMAKKVSKSVDQYIATFTEDTQRVLQQLRGTIRKALPGAQEAMSYNMPAYRLDERPVVWFAGWKKYFSVYPLAGRLFEALKDDLEPYKVNKNTLRFPLSETVPVKLIERIVKFRARKDSDGRHAYRRAPKAR